MNTKNDVFEINRKLWDNRTKVHVTSSFYDNENFITHQNSLNEEELALLGDINGKELLHLMCHFGQDTISLSKLGAKCTGVDFSKEAIKEAKLLANKCQSDAVFIESNVYELPQVLTKKFDIVFSSYGVSCWLDDLNRWARVVSDSLIEGGKFVLVELHPTLQMMHLETGLFTYPYDSELNPIIEESDMTYTGDRFEDGKLLEYTWNHSLSSLFKAFLDNGLELSVFNELDYCPYDLFGTSSVRVAKGFIHSVLPPKFPYIYAVIFKKKR